MNEKITLMKNGKLPFKCSTLKATPPTYQSVGAAIESTHTFSFSEKARDTRTARQ